MPLKAYWASVRLGGGTGASDKIDGADLADKDGLILLESTDTARFYWLDDDASASEGEGATNPDTNPGTKSWLLLGITLPNTGLHLLDTDATHDLIIKPGSDLGADRTLTLTTGDAARTITLTGNPTLADWFDQAVKVASNVTHNRLALTGGFRANLVTKTGNYTTTADDYTINCDASGASRTITLIDIASYPRGIYKIKKIDSSANTVTVDGDGSETIDGALTAVLTAQYESITVQNDTTEWWIY